MKIVIDTSMFNIKQVKRSVPDTGNLTGEHNTPWLGAKIDMTVNLERKQKIKWLEVFQGLLGASAVSKLDESDIFDGAPRYNEQGMYETPPVGFVAKMYCPDNDETKTVDVLAVRGDRVFVIPLDSRTGEAEPWSGVTFFRETADERRLRTVKALMAAGDAKGIIEYMEGEASND